MNLSRFYFTETKVGADALEYAIYTSIWHPYRDTYAFCELEAILLNTPLLTRKKNQNVL